MVTNLKSDKKRHAFLRRIASPLFSQAFLNAMEPTIKSYYNLFIEGILNESRQSEGIVDLTKWIDHLLLDVIASYENYLQRM